MRARKPEYQGPEAYKKAMKEWPKKVMEAGVEILFWGASLGARPDSPFVNTRTNVIIEF